MSFASIAHEKFVRSIYASKNPPFFSFLLTEKGGNCLYTQWEEI